MLKRLLFSTLFIIFFNTLSLAQLHADFSSNITSGCSPLIVQFINTSTGSPNRYSWTFGNGGSSSQQNPGVIYINPGTYTVTLTIYDNTGRDSISRMNYITVFPKPSASFSGANLTGCIPLISSFTDNSTPGLAPISQWLWDFGDGHTSDHQNPANTYTAAGDYNVLLIVRDTMGCTDSYQINFMVHSSNRPRVIFEPQSFIYECSIPTTVSFINRCFQVYPRMPFTYYWSFGDSTHSTEKNPLHIYSNYGSYNVSLSVTDTIGCSASLTRNSLVRIYNYLLNFSMINAQGCEPLTVRFTNLSNQHMPWQTITWDFGDGDTLSGPANQPGINNVTHTYSEGTYQAKISYTGANDSCYFEYISPVIIRSHPSPLAGFTAIRTNGCNDTLTVAFIDTSHNADSWFWDFGDGNTSALQNPVHFYSGYGDYDVTLIVRSANGCRDTILLQNYISIHPVRADFAATSVSGCTPLHVTYHAITDSINSSASYFWDFGNGEQGTGPNLSTDYQFAGSYDVKLVVTTPEGCADSLVMPALISVNQSPVADFHAVNGTTFCHSQMPVEFANTSSPDANFFIWDFGDHTQETTFSHDTVDHGFNLIPGFYDITLYAFNNGCSDTLIRVRYIDILSPISKFRYELDSCRSDTVHFYDLSTIRNSIFYRHWDFGTGNPADTSCLMNPSFLFPAYDTFRVSLTCKAYNYIWDSSQTPPVIIDTIICTDRTSKQVIPVNMKDSGVVYASIIGGCEPLDVSFTCTTPQVRSCQWDFGDGNTSADINPSHIYTRTGIYYVSCTATNIYGCNFYFNHAIAITVSGPHAGFTAAPSSGCMPVTVAFQDTSDSFQRIVYKHWDFGDGNDTVTDIGSVNHIYGAVLPVPNYIQAEGFIVTLTVTDSAGCTSQSQQPLSLSRPEPDFLMETIHRCGYDSIIFTPVINDTNGYPPLSIYWDFGNGHVSTVQGNVACRFNNGSYNVTLYATDGNNCTNTVVKPLNVNYTPPAASFSATPLNESCPPVHVFFTSTSSPGTTGPIVSWLWDLGENTHATIPYPEKVYLNQGVFTVKLTVTDSTGCSNTLQARDLINLNGPLGTYLLTGRDSCANTTYQFSSSSPSAISFLWDTGDGCLINGRNIIHRYTSPGNYVPLLILTDAGGCTRIISPNDTIKVFPLPRPAFTYSASSLCEDEWISLTDMTHSDFPVINRLWDFGDGSSSTLTCPLHQYTSCGNYSVTLTVQDVHSCMADTTMPAIINVRPRPVAGFNFSAVSYCERSVINFTDISTTLSGTIVEWRWTFGDGQTSSLQHPLHSYQTQGAYHVTLIVKNNQNCYDTASRYVNVFPLPVADFTFSDECAGTPVAMSDQSTIDVSTFPGSVTSYVWNFGDNTTSTQSNPVHTYTEPGNFAIGFIAVSNHGCRDTMMHNIRIYPSPIVDFSHQDVCFGQTMFFTDLSSHYDPYFNTSVSNIRWEFGDLSVSTTNNPGHLYSAYGQYVVTLTEYSTFNCSGTASDTVKVYPIPAAAILANDTCMLEGIMFRDISAINDVFFNSTISQWNWDFGDGSFSSDHNPVHSYNQSGTYGVNLIIETNHHCLDTVSSYVNVFPLPLADYTVGSVCLDDAARFSNFSSMPDTSFNSSIVSYNWFFGDGNRSYDFSPSHTYNNWGIYSTSLTVQTNHHCLDSYSRPLQVNPNPSAAFRWSDVCLNELVVFNDSSSIPRGRIINWLWEFDDGTTSAVQNPAHLFNSDGIYNVNLTVTSDSSCQDRITHQVNIHPLPIIRFGSVPLSGCEPLTVSFSDSSYVVFGNIVSRKWNFGSGDTSLLSNPAYLYRSPGIYDVELECRTESGCAASLLKPRYITVYPKPVSAFTADVFCLGQPTHFTDMSLIWDSLFHSSVTRWEWNFGDGYASPNPDPLHQYLAYGPYPVQLIVSTDKSCIDTILNIVNIYPRPLAGFMAEDTCAGITVRLTDTSMILDDFFNSVISSWIWSFGDGTGSFLQNNDHLYPDQGDYTTTLISISDHGCRDTATGIVNVFPLPVAGFSFIPACEGENVFFFSNSFMNDTSHNSSIINYWWDFSDTSSATGPNAGYTYYTHGYKPVRLIVETNHFCRDTVNGLALVFSAPVAGFSNTEVCLHFPTEFENTSYIDTGSIVSWHWDYDDGEFSAYQADDHTFDNDGVFNVTLVVTSENGCPDTITRPVTVFPLPDVNFSAPTNVSCQPLYADFLDLSMVSSGSVIQWFWNFGNGDTSSLQNPTTVYTAPGNYNITLTVRTDHQCESSLTLDGYIVIHPDPLADFIIRPPVTDMYYPTIQLNDESSWDAVAWNWDFGDSTGSDLQHPTHTYAYPDSFVIRLIVMNGFGCTDTARQVIHVYPGTEFYIPNAFTPNGDQVNDIYNGKGFGIEDFRMIIFSRWGDQIFETRDLNEGWDGTKNGKIMPIGEYVYVITFRTVFRERKKYIGKFALIR